MAIAEPITWGKFKEWVEGQDISPSDTIEAIIFIPQHAHKVNRHSVDMEAYVKWAFTVLPITQDDNP